MLDSDLAELYGVETRVLMQAVRRNHERFPDNFMFQLSSDEFEEVRQLVGTKAGRGGRRKLPHAFTEHGAIMLASILNSPKAIDASIYVTRAFVKLRAEAAGQRQIIAKLNELARKVGAHDESIKQIVSALRQLMDQPAKKVNQIGFKKQK